MAVSLRNTRFLTNMWLILSEIHFCPPKGGIFSQLYQFSWNSTHFPPKILLHISKWDIDYKSMTISHTYTILIWPIARFLSEITFLAHKWLFLSEIPTFQAQIDYLFPSKDYGKAVFPGKKRHLFGRNLVCLEENVFVGRRLIFARCNDRSSAGKLFF